ncbi:DUF3127 domain-containing protein [Fodinibius halophilus]|uniref:DUF3127 domain-containing protein n=1 Tax=Fodinibius halophilus TaxID=1736908 RepID=A0A6M1TF40_9BACT|nr:DUF3127 domain-containing protein [Fodinibius halophilus]NGP89394.1 DUF3127 domain-containing protein [Fodinibius halophilus]
MDLQVKGKVTQILEAQSGEGKNGPWKKQDFILETQGKYGKKICITHWGDKIDQFNVQEGEELTVFIDIQSREYKGNWYTDVKAWKVERGEEGAPSQEAPFNDQEPTIDMSDMDHDVPF